MAKVCTGCGVTKTLTEFSLHPQARDGRNPKCKQCKNSQQREHYEANRTAVLKRQQRRRRTYSTWRVTQYGMTDDEFYQIVNQQNGMCLFGHQVDGKAKLVIDHCHKTKRVRGVICNQCNVAIGLMKDDPARLRAAADYLDRFRESLGELPER